MNIFCFFSGQKCISTHFPWFFRFFFNIFFDLFWRHFLMRMRSHCNVSFLNHAQTDEICKWNELTLSKSSSVWLKHRSGLYRIILTAREPIKIAHSLVLTGFYFNQLIIVNLSNGVMIWPLFVSFYNRNYCPMLLSYHS